MDSAVNPLAVARRAHRRAVAGGDELKRAHWAAETMAPTHASLLADIVEFTTLAGWIVVITPRTGRHERCRWYAAGVEGEHGVSDALLFRKGRSIFVEVKVGHDRMREDQKSFRKVVLAQGFEYVEARSLDDIIAAGV
jgi:hypothetical protein